MKEYKYKGRETAYQREWARELRIKDPEKAKERIRRHTVQQRKRYPEFREKKVWVWDKLYRNYGLTQADYERMLAEQDHRCKICREVFVPTKSHPRLSVDHEHSTGSVCGLLCHKCNVGIGMFRENERYLLRAAAYIINSRSRNET